MRSDSRAFIESFIHGEDQIMTMERPDAHESQNFSLNIYKDLKLRRAMAKQYDRVLADEEEDHDEQSDVALYDQPLADADSDKLDQMAPNEVQSTEYAGILCEGFSIIQGIGQRMNLNTG